MVTYTVFNLASCPGEEVLGGLSLLVAVGRLMRLSGCNWWCRRDSDGIMHMDVFPEAAAVGNALSSANPDDDVAREEIFIRIADGQIILPSTYAIVLDSAYRQVHQSRRAQAAA